MVIEGKWGGEQRKSQSKYVGKIMEISMEIKIGFEGM
jgi:hypothetical protein